MESQLPSYIQPEMLEARSLFKAVRQYAAKPCESNHIPNSITFIRFQVLKTVSLLQCDCGLVDSSSVFLKKETTGYSETFFPVFQTKGSEFKTHVLSGNGLQNLPFCLYSGDT